MRNKRCSTTRALEILVGIVFIAGAILKALDLTAFAVQISYYGIIKDPWLVKTIAIGVVAMEMGLGLLLFLGIDLRRWTHRANLAVLIGFTGLLAYAWAFTDLEDCGCFGKYLQMSPGVSILKNLVLIPMVAVPMILRKRLAAAEAASTGSQLGSWRLSKWSVTTGSCIFLAILLSQGFIDNQSSQNTASESSTPPQDVLDRPFAKFRFDWEENQWDLGKGELFVALLSDSCEHCEETIENLKNLTEETGDILPVVALMLGEKESLEDLKKRTEPSFPMILIQPLEFFELIGDAPPRFAYIKDGKSITHWDEEIPKTDEIIALLVFESGS